MDQGTWNRLTAEQQSAVRSLTPQFIKAVQSSGAFDGWDFGQRFRVVARDHSFCISDGASELSGIHHSDRAVLEALMTDAVQNYGR